MTDARHANARPLPLRIFGRLSSLALRALGATWRTSVEGRNPLDHGVGPQIGVVWHEHVLVLAHHFRDRGFSVAVSRSRDGDWISAALPPLGYREPARGSSSRGGTAALLGLVRSVRAGTTVSVLADGPRGPAHVSKVGPVALARLTGVALTPVSFRASPAIRFASWDRTMLPLPFARIRVRFGEPIPVPPDANEREEEVLRARLEQELEALAS